ERLSGAHAEAIRRERAGVGQLLAAAVFIRRAVPASRRSVKESAFPGLVPGLHAERRAVVSQNMATTHAGGPGVLMAAWMILEMELAAQDSTQTFLPDDHTTVGYEICVRHRRATPVGEWFRVASELVEVDGRKL